MNLRIAWRNLWRNRKRTLITVSLIALSVSLAVFMRSFHASRHRRLPAFLFAFMMLATPLTYAATYYVSTTGSDANSGLSPAEAWRHIAFATTKVSPATSQTCTSIMSFLILETLTIRPFTAGKH